MVPHAPVALIPPDQRLPQLVWQVRLRWIEVAAQLVMIGVVGWWMGGQLPLAALLALSSVTLLTNVGLTAWLRRPRQVPAWLPRGLVCLDTLVLTALLVGSGGPHNPFSFLYLVHVVVAAVTLPERWAWGVAVLTIVAYGAQFPLVGFPAHQAHSAELMQLHLSGMWLAFAVTAPFTTLSVVRLRRALDQHEAERQRTARLASLATLAAGAAHELATPLSTIAVAAGEIAHGGDEASRADAELIREEIARCRDILAQLSADVGVGHGEASTPTTLGQLLEEARRGDRDVTVVLADPDLRLRVPLRLVGQVLRALVGNARDATGPDGHVEVRGAPRDGALVIQVVDDGPGMARHVLAHALDPFFTTKPPGQGMGLGLYFCRSVVDRLGGELTLESREGAGTTVSVRLPREVP